MRSAAGLKTSSSHRATARRESSAATSCALSPSPRAWRSRTRGGVDRPHGRRRADVRPPARCRSHRLRRRVLGERGRAEPDGRQDLASSALGRDDEWTGCGLNRGVAGKFPPEPVRYLGGFVVRGAVKRKESREDDGRSVDPVTRRVAALARRASSASNAELDYLFPSMWRVSQRSSRPWSPARSPLPAGS